jgi:WD40 repeat protein
VPYKQYPGRFRFQRSEGRKASNKLLTSSGAILVDGLSLDGYRRGISVPRAIAMANLFTMVALSLLTAAAPPAEPAAPDAASAEAPITDTNGDPLPEGAIARIGTGRLRCGEYHGALLGFSPDGKRLVSVGHGGICHWDVATGRLIRRLKRDDGLDAQYSGSPKIALSGDAATAALWTTAGHLTIEPVRVWDTASGQQRIVFNWDENERIDLPECVLSADGRLLAATACVCPLAKGTDSYPVMVWDVRKAQRLHVFTKHSAPLTALAFSHDCRTLLTVGIDRTLIAWDVESGKERYRVGIPKNETPDLIAVSGDDRVVAICGFLAHANAQRSLTLRDLASGKVIHRLQPEPGQVTATAFSPDGGLLALFQSTEFRPGTLVIYDLRTGRRMRRISGPRGPEIAHLVFAPDDKTLAGSVLGSPRIYVWDVRSGRQLTTPPGHDNAVSSMFFTNNGSTLLTHSYDGTLKLWSADNGAERPLPLAKTDQIAAVASSFDGRTMISLETAANHVRVWEAKTGKTVHSITSSLRTGEEGGSRPPDIYAFGSACQGKALLAAVRRTSPGWSFATCVWNVATGKLTNSWNADMGRTVLFSPDGRLEVSGTAVRETTAGQELCRLRPERERILVARARGWFCNPRRVFARRQAARRRRHAMATGRKRSFTPPPHRAGVGASKSAARIRG